MHAHLFCGNFCFSDLPLRAYCGKEKRNPWGSWKRAVKGNVVSLEDGWEGGECGRTDADLVRNCFTLASGEWGEGECGIDSSTNRPICSLT